MRKMSRKSRRRRTIDRTSTFSRASKALILASALWLHQPPSLTAQQHEEALTNTEIEQLRETNQLAAERIHHFEEFLNQRTDIIHKLMSKPRRPGREEDIREAMQQFQSIADDLEDNLDDYDRRHGDMRSQLPKLLKAFDRWTEVLNAPPANAIYNVDRALSLETLSDLRAQTIQILADQEIWFKAHPPSRQPNETPSIP